MAICLHAQHRPLWWCWQLWDNVTYPICMRSAGPVIRLGSRRAVSVCRPGPAHLGPLPQGPLGPGPIGPRARLGQGPFGPRARLGPGSGRGPGAHGPWGPWAHGPMGPAPWALYMTHGPWAHGPSIWDIPALLFPCVALLFFCVALLRRPMPSLGPDSA